MGTEAEDYASARIRKTRWGAVVENGDDSWTTRWRIGIDPVDDPLGGRTSVEILRDDERGFEAVVSVVAADQLELKIDTDDYAMSAPYYPLTFQAFGAIDSAIASIVTIEGQPKEWYAPFRN